jgi:hypothetical protein
MLFPAALHAAWNEAAMRFRGAIFVRGIDVARRIHFLYHSPGRIRIQVDGLKHNGKLAQAIQSLADKVQGLTQIEASTLTGSVLIRYDTSGPHVLGRLESLADETDVELLLDQLIADPNMLASRINEYGVAR